MWRSIGWNRGWLFSMVVFSLLGVKPPGMAAAEKSAEPKSSSDASGEPAAGAALAAFDRQFAEWKRLLAEIRKVQEQYQVTAEKRERSALAEKFEQLLAQGREMASKLVAAAERAYVENPQSTKLADFLVAVTVDDVRAGKNDGNDKYEEAYRIGNSLVAAGNKSPAVYNALGVAAFCVNDYDLARKYLNLAADQKSLNDSGKNFLSSLDDTEKLWAKESQIRAAEAKADDLPRVKIVTTKGDIVIELFENEAPNTTANFISLIESGFYKETPFHRVLPNFMAQGGDPTGAGSGGPGYAIACECYRPDFRRHFRGSLSMAHAGRDTGGSQFFLTFVPTVSLNGKHTVFGRIIEGMDVLDRIQRIDPDKSTGAQPDRIQDAVVLRKRSHPYIPVKRGQ
jgi:cyclophilin family peptidyl-prolyl cis-trans isomerase